MLRGTPRNTSGGRSLYILHVEDDAAIRAVIRRIFANVGHEVHSVADAVSAFELLSTVAFDVIIMDRNMDGMDGIQATRAIRGTHGPVGLIPIIGLTGSNDADDIAACRDAGMNAVLTKPVPAKILRDTVATVVAHGFEWRADQMEARLVDAHAASIETDVVDLGQLAETLGETDPVELLAHLRLFLEHLPRLIDRIERAAADGIDGAMIESAHAAKGAAATAAAHRLRDLFARIEAAARDGAWPEVAELIPAIRPESSRIQSFVDNHV